MGRLSGLFKPQNKTYSVEDLKQDMYWGYGTSNSGISVTPRTSMECSAVYACVQVISQTVGQLPLYLYEKTTEGKRKAVDHVLFDVIGSRPNPVNTSLSFREMLTAQICLRGNGYAYISRVGKSRRIKSLIPLPADSVSMVRLPNSLDFIYQVSSDTGVSGEYLPDQILHIIGLTLDGFTGVSPLTYARETIGLSMATEKHGAKLFKNGAKPSGVLSHSKRIPEDVFERLKESLIEEYSGDNAHKAMVLEDGMTWAPITMTSEDAQFLQTRQFQIPEIARFFRMPLHKIQDLTRSTNNNIEQQSLEFLTDTMMPWIIRWEQSLNNQLLTPEERKRFFFKFDFDDLLRADMKSRFEAYQSAITARIFSPNECREKEDMNPYNGGDEYINPAITQGESK